MDVRQAHQRIEELSREVEHHRFCYYVLDRPEVTDAEFDRLFEELKGLEEQFPQFQSPTSPTQTVGPPPGADFSPVQHQVPLLSLGNALSFEELDKWQERMLRSLGSDKSSELEFVCELKIDGLSVALTYRKGFLATGATRGDGYVGEDVTANLRTIAGLPQQLSGGAKIPELLEVRGEVYLPLSSFIASNRELAENGQPIFANPRNAASGSLRQKNPKITAKRNLSIWTYAAYIQDALLPEPDTHVATLNLLKAWGFPVNPNNQVSSNLSEVKDYCRRWQELRHGLEYQTDGVVIKLNQRANWDLLGSTSHSPRWAIAFKYPPEEVETQVENIQFEVGRTGAITPVACLTPVKLAGTVVQRASLHNADQIKRLGVQVGDSVVVRKAGEIIPEVVLVNLHKRGTQGQEVVFPTACPACGYPVVRLPEEVAVRCPNAHGCPAQVQRRLEHWVSRGAMDIEGMGEVLVKQLFESDLVREVADIYDLTAEQLLDLERMGQKSVESVLLSIGKSKHQPLDRVIYGLGIRHVGSSASEILAERFHGLEELSQADIPELTGLVGIGSTIAQSIKEFFANPEQQELICRLKHLGIGQVRPTSYNPRLSSQLSQKTFVLTGELSSLAREEAEKLIKAHGGKTSTSVSKKTDYVLAGANPGSKLAKAIELGIKVIDEAKFKELLEVHS